MFKTASRQSDWLAGQEEISGALETGYERSELIYRPPHPMDELLKSRQGNPAADRFRKGASGAEIARRRQGRFGSQRSGKCIAGLHLGKAGRRGQNDRFAINGKLKFKHRSGGLILFFRLLGGGNGLAQAAGMQAIEGLRHGLRHGLRAQMAREHRGPRDRLQRGPVQPGRQDQGHNHQDFTATRKHGANLGQIWRQASKL